MMYPLFLDLAGKRCLVVGGGRVALRKVLALLRSDADVTVITAECCDRLRRCEKKFTLHIRPFRPEDLTHEYILVISATDNQEVNRTISQLAHERNILCNIVDQPALCSFIVPAQVRRGNVAVAISTNAVSPRLSAYLKKKVAQTVEPVHGELAAYLGTIRKRIRTELPDIRLRTLFWNALFAVDPIDEIREHGWNTLRNRTERLITETARQAAHEEKK
jgi:siroheme synthase-like protein